MTEQDKRLEQRGEDATPCAYGDACGPASAGEATDTTEATNEAPGGAGEAELGEAVELPYCVAQSYGGWTVRNTLTGSMSGWWSRCEEAEEDAQRANLQASDTEEATDTSEAKRAPLTLEAKTEALLSVCRDGGFSEEFTAAAVARMVRGHVEHSGGDQGDPHLDFLAEAREEGLDLVCYLAMHRANGGDVLDWQLEHLRHAFAYLGVS